MLTLNSSTYWPSYTHELYSGGTTITQGVLSFTTGVLNGTGPITMNGGVLQWNNSNDAISTGGTNADDVSSQLVMVNGIPATLDLNGNKVTFSNGIGSGSSASLVLVGSGFLTLQAASTYTGSTTVSAGTLEAAIPAALPNYSTSGNVFVGSGACLAVTTGGSADWTSDQIDALRANTTWTDNTAILGFDTSNGTFAYGGDIVEGLSLKKMGSNMLTLTGTNSYSGATSVNGGTLQLGSPCALPAGTPVTLANTAGAVLDLNGFSPTIGALTGGGTNGGNITLGGGTLTAGDATNATYSGSISGSGAVIKQGFGTLTFTASHSYSGATVINDGTLMLQPSGSDSAMILPAATPVTIDSPATLDLGGTTQQIASLSDASPGNGGSVINSSQALSSILVISPSGGSATFSGQIEGGGSLGTLALVMSGSGVQVLAGANTYTGGTFVAAGTLEVVSSAAILDGSSLTVGNAAAFAPAPVVPAASAPSRPCRSQARWPCWAVALRVRRLFGGVAGAFASRVLCSTAASACPPAFPREAARSCRRSRPRLHLASGRRRSAPCTA